VQGLTHIKKSGGLYSVQPSWHGLFQGYANLAVPAPQEQCISFDNSMRIYVHVPSQTLDLLDGDTLLRRYAISSSRFGLGSEAGSNRTPVGRFRIAEKHGDGAEPGMVFVSRQPTGQIGREDDPKDNVQTRILWLDGVEEENANTYDRYVYIHGTNAESRLGMPASEGCIRMSNADVIDLYDIVEAGTEVVIDPGDDERDRMAKTGDRKDSATT
jgi:L,D-transpeptidase YbiS